MLCGETPLLISLILAVGTTLRTTPTLRAVQNTIPIRLTLLQIRVRCARLLWELSLSSIHHMLRCGCVRSGGLVWLKVLPCHSEHVLHFAVEAELLGVSEATTY